MSQRVRNTRGASISMTTIAQPTIPVALTTVFTPPSTCQETRITQLSVHGNRLWLNEPVPAPGQFSTACYPPEFMKSYQSVNSGNMASSLVPAMSGLRCPANYCTAYVKPSGNRYYLACCPNDFLLSPPKTIRDSDRPAYGGTCYSEMISGSTYIATVYDENGSTATADWFGSRSGDQMYAHPIDGYADSFVTSTCATPGQSPDSRHHTPLAAIIGGSVGGALALSLLIALVWIVLRRRHRAISKYNAETVDKPADLCKEVNPGSYVEIASSGSSSVGSNAYGGFFEIDSRSKHELAVSSEQ